MESKTYTLTDAQVKNILVFLNRVKYEGLTEVQAVFDIMRVLHPPSPTKA